MTASCKLSYCFVETGGADFGSVERTIRAKKVSISYKLRGHDEGGRSGVAASGVLEPAVSSFSVVAAGGVFSVGTAGIATEVVFWPFCHPLGAKFAPPPMMTACPSYRGLSASHPWRCR